ncbi:MAG: hypothetical protein LLG44_13380 [Chloroflexi bacterium]|nr:hypothetical protein [Chloroflexota bacterium]
MSSAARVSNEEKKRVWEAYRARKPVRVPVTFSTNPRIILLNPRLNPEGYSFESYFYEPEVTLEVQLRWQRYRSTVIAQYCDDPLGLPESWQIGLDRQNVYESVFFGAPLVFRAGQVPDVRAYLDDEHRDSIFDIDIEHPLEHGFFKQALDYAELLRQVSAGRQVDGLPFKINDYTPTGCDGPLTVAANIRGEAILADLIADQEYANRLFGFIIQAAINRVRAVRTYYQREDIGCGLADDSIQLISSRTYREMLLPHHRQFYDTFFPGQPRSIHLCGDAQRHFKMLRDELNVQTFDTGFPIDFSKLRRDLGPDVEIFGGPPVSTLLLASADQVYNATKDILLSGIKEGGRFVLKEANNLPPMVPETNLEAMYQACLDYGTY